MQRCVKISKQSVKNFRRFNTLNKRTFTFACIIHDYCDSKKLDLNMLIDLHVLRCIGKTITVVTASVKEVERGGQGHTTAKPIASVCHVTPRCEHTMFLHKCFFDLVFHFVCDGWQNRAKCLHKVLHEAR
jgi:hypothetical protein